MYIIEFILIVVIKKMQHFVLKKYVKSFYIFFFHTYKQRFSL